MDVTLPQCISPARNPSPSRALLASRSAVNGANPQVRVFATCPHNHIQVISKDAATIAAAITDVLTR
ncbi:hypothetical protein ACIBG8_06995 [Nonomuraea sp. NPDC050556]|uniref:hypothetical protein n=1 Tax=Nonomuraea sp. NPDC050556 TaxID=3364369 RepID=UPI00379E85D9